MLVLLNPCCNYGTGLRRWRSVAPELHSRVGSFALLETCSAEDAARKVSAAIKAGERVFLAAGGDGTVNSLLNAVVTASEDTSIVIGGIGLGSSNDFHKPLEEALQIDGIPLKTNVEGAKARDIIKVSYAGTDGWHERYCLLNASIGVTAEANAFFNRRTRVIGLLQRLSVNLAIVATALRTTLVFRNLPVCLTVDDSDEERLAVTNLGVIKTRSFAGRFCYDTPVADADGKLRVNLCEGLTRLEMIAMLTALSRHRFMGRAHTRTWRPCQVRLSARNRFALEMDGEVVDTNQAVFSVLPSRVRCCR